jgi:hypothetical protein
MMKVDARAVAQKEIRKRVIRDNKPDFHEMGMFVPEWLT